MIQHLIHIDLVDPSNRLVEAPVSSMFFFCCLFIAHLHIVQVKCQADMLRSFLVLSGINLNWIELPKHCNWLWNSDKSTRSHMVNISKLLRKNPCFSSASWFTWCDHWPSKGLPVSKSCPPEMRPPSYHMYSKVKTLDVNDLRLMDQNIGRTTWWCLNPHSIS